jgi:UDPglucose 6-dehydrogenase
MIGLGKLGLPCVLAMEKYTGHEFYGYDISSQTIEKIRNRKVTYWEEGVNDLLSSTKINICDSIEQMVTNCDIIFIAVQTPHEKNFEGRTPMPTEQKNFDYSYLKDVADEIATAMQKNHKADPLIVVISTVLPGTMRGEIFPILSKAKRKIRFAYNPYFIAMGTTIWDFLNPEFILIGVDDENDGKVLENFYDFINAKKMVMQIESAELTKVSYNTFIGFKIVFANIISEITEKVGGNPDQVTAALSIATNRIMSGAYMTSGMGDGGGCHPRDQIAMSWLAKELNLSSDLFEFLARARDAQTDKFAELIKYYSELKSMPACILGVAYKANSPLDVGSPARLLEFYLAEKRVSYKIYDNWVDTDSTLPVEPHIFFVGVRHKEFREITLPSGSIVIDPWGFVQNAGPNVQILKVGRESNRI